jgi:hypothetical protein
VPRASAEARAMDVWRAEASVPLRAPSFLSPEAQVFWTTVVGAYPHGHFRAGSEDLLAGFCQLQVHLNRILSVPPESAEDLERQQKLLARSTLLAEKLRLTPSTYIYHKSQRLGEPGADAGRLLGGRKVAGPT